MIFIIENKPKNDERLDRPEYIDEVLSKFILSTGLPELWKEEIMKKLQSPNSVSNE